MFQVGDKIRNTISNDVYTIIGIVNMTELKSSSYYKVLSKYLTSHRIKFKTAEKNFELIDHLDIEDTLEWLRK
jgi:hypothetical protein